MKNELKILIVEDEEVVRESTKKILFSTDFIVEVFINAETAYEHLMSSRYDIVISDIMLPKMSGIQFLDMVKNLYPYIPVIMITGYSTLGNVIASFKYGAFDFIPKPFTMDELLSVVQRAEKYTKTVKKNSNHEDITANSKKRFTDYYFLGHHSWVKFENDGTAKIGAGTTFSRSIQDISSIEFPEKEIVQAHLCARINTSDQMAHRVWAPLSGEVIANNDDLLENSKHISTDPFSKGWLTRIKPTNVERELVNLFTFSDEGFWKGID